jgi:hypothetical protein
MIDLSVKPSLVQEIDDDAGLKDCKETAQL